MKSPFLEAFRPHNTTILMVDYSAGFINTFRSHSVNDHITNTVALAKTAIGFKSGLVVNLGKGQTPYPQIVQAIGSHPIIYRGGEYNALDNAGVLAAVKATGRENLVIAGISTDGCVIQTVMGALRLGFNVGIVEDATAGLNKETHDISIQRMVQAGAVPITSFALATEFQMDWENQDTAQVYFGILGEASPGLGMSIQAEHAAGEKK